MQVSRISSLLQILGVLSVMFFIATVFMNDLKVYEKLSLGLLFTCLSLRSWIKVQTSSDKWEFLKAVCYSLIALATIIKFSNIL
ncbi:hypothetical protein SAMN04515674_106155 [Pseudarcicella hirudinis]|uniref:Uncharacterized protein n=1 Tax=Pseudarcicella hirudinis TaxID=1079859 RepID=A0A1I5TRS8_9BACT|nr:hypothetical protein [Pseudarcicella hirudinis]SFP85307.1 hypothetical protein SAMN04515674_106155 [Pseudarcicella hirudinis]